MSKYTTEVRFICESVIGMDESMGANNVDEIIDAARPFIFNFEYPIFDVEYKGILEKKILKHFYTREIGLETYGLWKLKLNTKLNEIMPYYNRLYNSELLEYNPLYTTDITKTKNNKSKYSGATANSLESNKDVTGNKTSTESNASSTAATNNASDSSITNANSTSTAKENGNRANTNLNAYSDTPQGQLNNLEGLKYLTNATQIDDNTVHHTDTNQSDTEHSDTVNNSISHTNAETNALSNVATNDATNEKTNANSNTLNTSETLDDYIEHVTGYEGKDVAELVLKFRKTFLNIDMMIIKDLEELFMQLW